VPLSSGKSSRDPSALATSGAWHRTWWDGVSAKVRGVRLRLLVAVAVAAAALTLVAPSLAAPPSVVATAYLVANASTGEVLASRNADAQVPIASITKLMTVLVVLEHAKPTDVVTVRRRAAAVGESTIHLRAGERITVGDLIDGALIQSANDAADALADYVGHGNVVSFVALMNAKARRLGLTETHFSRPDGLDAPGHVSSARDVVKLAEIAMHNPIVRATVRRRTAAIEGGRVLHTWNDLLGTFPGLIGVKTGHTGDAGWCQVAAARGRGLTIYAAVLGSPTRAVRNDGVAALLAWGLTRYRVVPLVDPDRAYASVAVGWGLRPVRLVAPRPLVRSVRLGRSLVERVAAPVSAPLPVRKGDRLGEVRVYYGGRLVGTEPLVAARSAARPGLGRRMAWYAGRTVHHMWGWFS
jgi:serine-type D-Ala-D-Ala carboxypeptidase (penicillin-binding protein 5/6)